MSSSSKPCRPVAHPARLRAFAPLFRAVAGGALAGALGACGGGGQAGSPSPPSAPVPAPAPAPAQAAPIAAQLSVPAPVGYDADRLAAFDRLNEIRLSAGLGMLVQTAALDQAAQAHADWIIANDSFTHDEGAGTPGFTGAHWWDRAEALGYVPLGGGEVMSGPVHGAEGVDALINMPYHRAGMLAFEPVDVGVGWSALSAAGVSMPLVIELTRPGTDATRGLGQAAQPAIGGVAIWPLDEARDVPIRLGLESPNPVPGQDVLTLGTPVSITVDRAWTISTATWALTNLSTGASVVTSTLTFANDPNGLTPGSFAAAVPLAPLLPESRYLATFSGTAETALTGAAMRIDRTWSFTTASH
jgi:uncharacterized protein YkwD